MDPTASSPEAKTPGDPAAEPAAPPEGAALEAAVARLTDVVDGLRQLTEVRLARAKIEFRERVFRVAGWGLLGIFLATMVVLATLRTTSGVAGWFASRFPSDPWMGDLLAGIGAFAVAAVVALAVRSRFRRRNLRRMRKRFEEAT